MKLTATDDGWTISCGGLCGADNPFEPPVIDASEGVLGTNKEVTLGEGDYLNIKENCPGKKWTTFHFSQFSPVQITVGRSTEFDILTLVDQNLFTDMDSELSTIN